MSGKEIGIDRVPWVSARLDRLPATRSIWKLVALISFGAFFEIYDLTLSGPLSLGLLAAGIFRSGSAGFFGLTDQATFVAATFAGLWVGTIGFSAAADRFGRRPIFTFALLWYAVATVVMGLQSSAIAIIIWRLIASIGVGIELVAIDCYLAELMPARVRGRAFAFSTSIQFLSVPIVAVLAWLLIPGVHLGVEGWRWLALLPAVGAVLVWWVRLALPESPRWLAAHGRESEAGAVLARMERNVARDLRIEVTELPAVIELPPVTAAPSPDLAPVPRLWDVTHRRTTAVLVVFHLFQSLGYFGFSNWLPTLLVSQGVTISKSLGYSAILAIVPPVAPLLFMLVADRIDRKWLLTGGALVAAVAGVLLSTTTNASGMLEYTLFGGGTAIGLSMMSFAYHTYQSEVFPTEIRARGVGFVYSFSRLSSVFSSYLIAFTLSRAGSDGVFILIAGAMVIVAIDVGMFGPNPAKSAASAIGKAAPDV
jgi:putative MFS transporter